jgi:glycosyltransferase involved in cell wall biosynthesis
MSWKGSAARNNKLENMPLVAVIIPAYKSDQTIAHCLETMKSQIYPAVEIIVVDSSPNSQTAQAARTQYAHIRYIRSSVRLLPHAARNLV